MQKTFPKGRRLIGGTLALLFVVFLANVFAQEAKLHMPRGTATYLSNAEYTPIGIDGKPKPPVKKSN